MALRKFCAALEIDYQDSMVHWVPAPEDQKDQFPGEDEPWGSSVTHARLSAGFVPYESKAQLKDPNMAGPLEASVAHGMPVYLKLKQLC